MGIVSANHRRPLMLLFRALIVAFVLGINYCPASAETLVVQGSTTFFRQLMETHQSAIEAKAGHKLTVFSNKSSLGHLALFEHRADLAMISAPLEDETATLRKSNPALPFERLQSFEIERTRVAFAVHPSNPIRAISIDQIRKILLGEINNWQQLGGSNIPIRLVAVRGGGGVTTAVE